MAGQADRRFVKHPPWVKIPIPDRGNLRSQFSKLDADERCLILDIEDNCEAIWYSGMRIGESWKEIAEEQYLMCMAKHGQRYAQEANKIFAIRLKRHIENYCQFYASQLDLSIDQAVKQSQGGHHTQETLKNKKELEDSCEVSSSLAEGKLEDSFKQEEEDSKKEDFKEEYIYNSNGKVLCKRSEVNRFRDSWMRIYGLTSFPLTDDKDTLFMMARCSEEHPEDLDQFIISRKNLFRHDQVFSFLCKRKSQES